MIENFINSALIIDDDVSEIQELQRFLEERDIWVKHYTPSQLDKMERKFKNRKIIFLDLYLSNAESSTANIARIRKYFSTLIGKDFGSYGIVVWTKHLPDVDEFKRKISLDSKYYSLPLFIIGLDKTIYLKQGNYDNILQDLEKQLHENIASAFFINWNILVEQGKDRAIENIYNIENNYERQEQNLKFVLFQLAKNYNGIPDGQLEGHNLTFDTIKGFGDMLHYEITNWTPDNNFLFEKIVELFYRLDLNSETHCEYSSSNTLSQNIDQKTVRKNGSILSKKEKKEPDGKEIVDILENHITKIYSDINTKLLFDSMNLNQTIVLPGNIYEIIIDSPFKIDKEEIPAGAKNILIEVTPPCDFSNSKKGKLSRVVSGFLYDYTAENINTRGKGENYYKELWPVFINSEVPKILTFDFKYFGSLPEEELKDAGKYKLLIKAKDKLFADILQKLSSHTARLGLSIIR